MKRKFTFLMAAFTLLAFLAIPMGVKGQAQVGDTLWAENFSGYAANDVPSGKVTNSHTGTTVYGDDTLTYACSDGGTSTKIYDANLAGGSKPELLISKKNTESGGTFSISGISTGGAIELTLKYKENYDYTSVTSTTPEVTFSNKTFDNKTCTITITTNGVSSINLTFTNTNSSNVRVDDFSLIVKTSSSTDPYITAEDVTLDWDATSGEIDYTLNNAVTGGLLTAAATSGEWISNVAVDTENSKVTFTTTANPDGEREGTITITYTYNTNQTVTKEVAVTQQTRPSYTVTYVANGGTGTMTDPNSPYYSNADVTLLDNSFTAPEGQMWSAWVVTDGAGESITVTNGHFTMPESNVTVTPQWVNDPSAPTYEWVLTALADLTTSDVFVIVGTVSNSSYSMSNNSTSNPAAVAVTISNDKIISTVADSIKWNISGNATNGYTFYPNGSTTTWLYCNTTASSGSNTNLRVGGGNNATRKLFVPEGTTLKTKDSNTARFWNVYSGGPDWRGYTSNSTSTTVTFYKRQIASTDPYITASDVEIEYDATSGSFDFTLTNPADDGTFDVSNNVDWISEATVDGNATDGYSVSFATTVNEAATAREGIITITYSYNNNSETITKEVTITQAGNPNVFDNISDITEVSHAYTVRGTVVATNAKGFIMGDGTGYVYYYKGSAVSQSVGNKVKVSGTTGTYGQIIQFTSTASVSEATSSNYNNTPAAEVITAVPDYSTGYHLSTYLEFEGALSTANGNNNTTNYLITLGDAQIQISYPTTAQTTALSTLVGKNVHVKGYFSGINSSDKFSVMMESVEDLTPVTPVINADNVTLLYDATSGEIAYTISNPVTGVALEATTDAEWIDNITVGEASVTFTCSANEGTEDRTASFTLTYEGAENKVVNVTQGYYVVDFAVLPFEWAGGVKNDLLALNGVTANGLGSDYGDNNAPYRVKFDTEGDYIQVKTNEQPGIVTVGVKMIGGATTSKIVVQGSSDGVDFNNAIDTLVVSGKQNDTLVLETTHDFASTDRYVRLYFIKGSNVGVGPISIAQFDNTPSISASDVEIEYDVTSGAIAYTINRPVDGGVLTASVPDGSWVTLGTLGETVPFTCTANTAYTARTAIVTLTYTYGEESVTKDVTVTQGAAPEPLITLAPNMVNVGAEGGLCGFAVSLENIPASVNSGISVLFYPGLVEWIPDNGISYHNFNLNLMQMDSLYLTVLPNTTTESRSVDIKLVINGVQSNLVTIVQAAPYAPAFYTLATTIESGKQYIIVGLEGEKAYAMGEQKNNNRGGVIISKDGDTATVTRDAVYEFVITSSGENYTIYDARTPGYLCAASSNNNYLRTQVENDANGIWAIEIDQESGLATVEAQGSFTRRKMRFNYNGGNALFSCYASSSTAGTQVYFYVKDEVNTPSSYPLDIAGFGESEKGGYRLIASPINNLNPTAEGMTAGIYDLYAFDQSKESEWINYKAGAFNLISGKGYLYASKVDTTLSFIGSPYNGDGAVTLVYIDGAQFAGWNLIGNPFATAATLDKPYYRLNSDGSSLNTFTENTSVACMEGVFVKATEAGQTATFTSQTSKGEKKGIALLNLMVSGNRGMVNDNAIIRFDNGQTLEKFVLRKNGTKLYIVEGNKDYAIVRSNGQGEMPVNFKAETNGTYTISVNAENVEMNYLHLIDNLTGADVDLLATPSYSFEANTNDYATRFRLVFKANASVSENADAETFAFFNGSTWTVSNLGEATLQVVDVMGRVLSSETINGNAEISIKQEPGVYMLRLINGDNVKTQKVVVR